MEQLRNIEEELFKANQQNSLLQEEKLNMTKNTDTIKADKQAIISSKQILEQETERWKNEADKFRKQVRDLESKIGNAERSASEGDSRVQMIMRENEDLKREAKEETQKYHKLMQGIVQEQEQRLKLEAQLDEAKNTHRGEIQTREDEMQESFETEVRELKNRGMMKEKELELKLQTLEFESSNYRQEVARIQSLLNEKSKKCTELQQKLSTSLLHSASSSSIGAHLNDNNPLSKIDNPNNNLQHAMELEHLRKKISDQAKRIEVLICEKSALSLEIENGTRKLDLEALGAQFQEFAPHKVHRWILQFDTYCQDALLYIQQRPNWRVITAGYLIFAFFLDIILISRIAVGSPFGR